MDDSIAGLWAARVCADHFENVIVVEPEEWTTTEEAGRGRYDENGERRAGCSDHLRTRVYQYNSVHGTSFLYLGFGW